MPAVGGLYDTSKNVCGCRNSTKPRYRGSASGKDARNAIRRDSAQENKSLAEAKVGIVEKGEIGGMYCVKKRGVFFCVESGLSPHVCSLCTRGDYNLVNLSHSLSFSWSHLVCDRLILLHFPSNTFTSSNWFISFTAASCHGCLGAHLLQTASTITP